jgi:hypothetical protein
MGIILVDDALFGPNYLPSTGDNCPNCGTDTYWQTRGIVVSRLLIWTWTDTDAPTCRVCGHQWDLFDRDRKRREAKEKGGWWNE